MLTVNDQNTKDLRVKRGPTFFLEDPKTKLVHWRAERALKIPIHAVQVLRDDMDENNVHPVAEKEPLRTFAILLSGWPLFACHWLLSWHKSHSIFERLLIEFIIYYPNK